MPFICWGWGAHRSRRLQDARSQGQEAWRPGAGSGGGGGAPGPSPLGRRTSRSADRGRTASGDGGSGGRGGARSGACGELKQRLRALSAEERLRQSHLLAQGEDRDDSHRSLGAAASHARPADLRRRGPLGARVRRRAHVASALACLVPVSACKPHDGCGGIVGHSVEGISSTWVLRVL